MARYVLLAFDSNAEADAFIAAVDRNTRERGQIFYTVPVAGQDEMKIHTLPDTVDVRGLYMRPTQFCDCEASVMSAKDSAFTRGKKFGMWVHNKCGKPTKAWATGDHWFGAIGRNLLPVSATAPEWRGEGVAHHRWDPARQLYVHVETGKPWTGERS
jgi:hypothetical protein